jgi:hypothetical protein
MHISGQSGRLDPSYASYRLLGMSHAMALARALRTTRARRIILRAEHQPIVERMC